MYEHKVIVPRNQVVLLIDGAIQYAELQEGEMLVELENFNDFIKPLHDGEKWIEGASQEVLDAIETERNKPQPPSQTDRIKDLENTLISLMDFMMGGF